MGVFDSFKKIFSSQEAGDKATLAKKVQSAPQDPAARQKLAAALLRQGDVAEAMAELVRAAEIYEKIGFSTKAIAVLRQLLKQEPSHKDAQIRLVRLLATEGLTGDAQREVEKILAQDQFATVEARAAFYRRIADALPSSPLPGFLMADLLITQKKVLEAVAEMGRTVPLAVAAGTVPECAVRLRKLVSLAGNNLAMLEQVGFLWLQAGASAEGMTTLSRVADATAIGGDSARAADMQRVLRAIRDGNEALLGANTFADAVRILSERPSAPAPRPAPPQGKEAAPAPGKEAAPPAGGRAGAADDTSMVKEAVGKLQEKIKEEIGESDHETRYNLGIAYKEMGLLDEAAEEFRVSRGSDALYVGASAMLAETLAEKGSYDEALAVLDEMMSTGRVEAGHARDISYQKGVYLEKAGRAPEARRIFAAIHAEAPGYRDVAERIK